MLSFQATEEYASPTRLILLESALLSGFSFFIILSFLYFFPTHKTLLTKLGLKPIDHEEENEPVQSFFHKKVNWQHYFRYKKDRVYIYLVSPLKLRSSRSSQHYDKDTLERIFQKSRVSSTFFEVTTILAFLLVGIFRDSTIFNFPAGMSIVMLLTIIMMLVSALYSWFYYWTFPFILAVAFLMNTLSKHTQLFQYKNYALGMSYEDSTKYVYSIARLDSMQRDQKVIERSKRDQLIALKAWKKNTGLTKPKLIIVMTSGGGSRSAAWTFTVLQHLGEETDFRFFKHTKLITGASGGMIGAAYYRSLYQSFLEKRISGISDGKYYENVTKDLLNKLAISASTNDMFFRLDEVDYNAHTYTKDRGIAFEEQLNENTNGILDCSLNDFQEFEQTGKIPSMIFTPTIVNDGRRLVIGSQSYAFLCAGTNEASIVNDMYENIDFQHFFKGNTQVRFTSVLRMSSTFPLVLPMVSMPTKPEMHIMDAGIRDNYGGKMTMEYLNALSDWIQQNTSGVVIVKIRDTKKMLDGETVHKVSMLDKLTLPFGNMYKNFPRTQDFDQDELLKIGSKGFKFPIDMVIFNLRESEKDRISLSWHLTSQEKQKIKQALQSKGNRNATIQLRKLLNIN